MSSAPVVVHLPVLAAFSASVGGPGTPFEAPPERILSTLNRDGSRRWLEPKLSPGRFWKRRMVVAWALILLFAILPWLRIDGRPPILLDVMTRQFVFFGTIFRPTDTLLLALLLLAVFIGIFLLTALFGRVWCGWACPQTVYMEYLYRPVERFFLGKGYGNSRHAVPIRRRLAMYAVFLLFSAHISNTFLAYFVGTDRLVEWTLGSPFSHPTAFTVFAVTLGLMMFDFCFYREQLCTLVCPYGRFQSVLLDRDSIIVGYDRIRGEPRSKRTAADADAGSTLADRRSDCVDCTLCVQTCPTGIDIRDGLQLECIHCAQCIDACDAVMDKLGRPRGLIRYSTQNRLERTGGGGFRIRVILYPLLLTIVVAAFVGLLLTRTSAMVVQLRTHGTPYAVAEDGAVTNLLRLRIDNRSAEPRTYAIEGLGGAVLREPVSVAVDPSSSYEAEVRIVSGPGDFERGRRTVELRVFDGRDYDQIHRFSLVGPFGDGAPRLNQPPKQP